MCGFQLSEHFSYLNTLWAQWVRISEGPLYCEDEPIGISSLVYEIPHPVLQQCCSSDMSELSYSSGCSEFPASNHSFRQNTSLIPKLEFSKLRVYSCHFIEGDFKAKIHELLWKQSTKLYDDDDLKRVFLWLFQLLYYSERVLIMYFNGRWRFNFPVPFLLLWRPLGACF